MGKKAIIVCDPYCSSNGVAGKLQKTLQEEGINSVIYDKVVPNPTTDVIDEAAKIAKDEAVEFVIGLGGGSSMDTAKGIAVAATHEGSIWPYAMAEKEITSATLPVVAITTTSGTGSQCTSFSVITNPLTNQKPGMGSPYILPKVAIVDPELMLSVPQLITLNTGFDVFAHAVEAYTSKVAFPMSDILAEKAIELVVKYLPIVYKDGSNIEAREGLALADTYAGISLNNAVVSLAHVLAHAIPAKYHDIAHGDALYSVYAEVLKLNCKELVEKHEFIADQLEKGNKDVVSAFDKFFSQFNFENKFKSKNPDENAINTIAEAAFTYLKGVTDLNPVEVSVEDVRMILKNSIA